VERRNFLKGVFGGVTAAGLIVTAGPSEIAAFASPLVRDAPIVLDASPVSTVKPYENLYNSRGELVAIVRRVDISREMIDVTQYDMTSQMYIQGQRHITIEAEGVCDFVFKDKGFPEMRGRK
jgi:hypothetical protein